MKARQQSSTAYPIPFLMVLSSDHLTGATGLSPTVTISKNGGAFAAPAGSVTELGSGWYLLAGNATDRETLGELLLHAEAATADPVDERYEIVSWDPFADVAAIKERTDLIISGAITVASPVSTDGTTVTTYRGDDYDDAHSRQIDWTLATPNLTGATIVLHVGSLDITCTLADAGLSTQHFYAELTAVQSAALTATSYSYSVVATLSDSDVQTLVTGTWISTERAS